ncbi:MAG: uncharacterized protein JWO22_3955 [Frankiales bacterium]|nr:uncharacterized protein [Frankiales bacterium]
MSITSSPMSLALDDRFARDLPELAVASQATPVDDPQLLILNEPLAAELGLDVDWLRTPAGAQFLAGNLVPDGTRPVAQAYAGHQFGGFNPRLGDGRALLLGSINGRDLHLKGSGPTTFSRGGDGFAAVGPMLREYVVSEAMHALGIPTTRSLAVVATGRPLRRETGLLPGAVLARVATNHLRVGSFQYAAATGNRDLLTRLIAHAGAASAMDLLTTVIDRQASLIAQWMCVGFIHGVMNTDNMTISGETIDYGPCAFMDAYDPATVFSSIDTQGRYAYGNQPVIGEWNLARLAEALLPAIHDDEDQAVAAATEVLHGYRPAYVEAWGEGMRAKLGLAAPDVPLANDLLALLHAERVDYTGFFRALSRGRARDLLVDRDAFDAWHVRWVAAGPDVASMDAVNPVYIPRNHLVEEALASGDVAPLLDAVTHPFEERESLERFAEPGTDEGYRTFCGT